MAELRAELPRPRITPQGMVSELKRELQMRARVYPRYVADGRLSESDARFRVAALEEVLAVIERVYAEELKPPQAEFAV